MKDKISLIKDHLYFNYDIKNPEIILIDKGVINLNYKIITAGNSYIFKIFNLRDIIQVEFELGILNHLKRYDFPSPRVQNDNENRQINMFNNKPSVLFYYIPGEILDDITLDEMFHIGQLTGSFHKELLHYKQPISRVTWEPEDIRRHIKNEKAQIISKGYPDAKLFISYISEEFKKLNFPDSLPIGMTHQDIKPENIVRDNNDCYRGVLLFDVMTMVIWSCFKSNELMDTLFQSYLRGYLQIRPFCDSEMSCCHRALQFRLLREAFVWPMRFSPEIALEKSQTFLNCYKYVKRCKSSIEDIVSLEY
jgi:Ser/Thr protein kinase RdoA (MazF antagonist)